MGNCLTSDNMNAFELGYWNKWSHILETLHFTIGEFKQLLFIFEKMDKDKSGSIELKEFLYYLNLQNNHFFERAFSILDEDQSGEIDFGEFVVSLWNYCTFNRNSLVIFAFHLYDKDKSGHISKEEVKMMLHDLYGEGSNANRFARASLAKMENVIDSYTPAIEAETADNYNNTDKYYDYSEGINQVEFVKLVRKYPTLLFPTFEIQNAIRTRILGNRFWDRLSQQTLVLPNGSFITIAEYKEQELYKDLLKSAITMATSKSASNKSTNTVANTADSNKDNLPKRKRGTVVSKRKDERVTASSELASTRTSVGTLVGGSVPDIVAKHSIKNTITAQNNINNNNTNNNSNNRVMMLHGEEDLANDLNNVWTKANTAKSNKSKNNNNNNNDSDSPVNSPVFQKPSNNNANSSAQTGTRRSSMIASVVSDNKNNNSNNAQDSTNSNLNNNNNNRASKKSSGNVVGTAAISNRQRRSSL